MNDMYKGFVNFAFVLDDSWRTFAISSVEPSLLLFAIGKFKICSMRIANVLRHEHCLGKKLEQGYS